MKFYFAQTRHECLAAAADDADDDE